MRGLYGCSRVDGQARPAKNAEGGGKRTKGYAVDATLNDSPHPHASTIFGFLNTNLELREIESRSVTYIGAKLGVVV